MTHPLPQNWLIKELGNVAKVITGSTPSTKETKFYGDDYLFVSPADLEGKYVRNTAKKLSALGFEQCRKIPEGAVLFTCIGATIGKIGIASKELATNQQINAIVGSDVNNDFLYYQLIQLGSKIKLMAATQTIPIINKSLFETVDIFVPPLPEQHRIVAVLETWDKAIEKLERRIELKEQVKAGLAQRLLTGRVRLPGLQEKWKPTILGNITERIRRKNDVENSNILTISAQDGLVHQGYFFNKQIASENLKNYTLLKKGDFAYNKSYSKGYPMGAIKRLKAYDAGIVSSLYICFRSKDNVDADFLDHYFDAGLLNQEIGKVAQEGARNHGLLNIGVEEFFGSELHLPPIKEQGVIAKILLTSEKEVCALKKTLERLKDQKTYLLNHLITGRIRTPENMSLSTL